MYRTKWQQRAEDYLLDIYNGTFIAKLPLTEYDKEKFLTNFLDNIKGDWRKIEEIIIASLPTDPSVVYKDIATFFWNEFTQRSIFLYRCPIRTFSPYVPDQDLIYIKSRKQPFDYIRCSEVMCPKYESCGKAIVEGNGGYVYTQYVFDDDGCENFVAR